jgi:molybdopterin-binding protein
VQPGFRHGRLGDPRRGQRTVNVDIGDGNVITSSITEEAITGPSLALGDAATVMIRASDVLIGKKRQKGWSLRRRFAPAVCSVCSPPIRKANWTAGAAPLSSAHVRKPRASQ